MKVDLDYPKELHDKHNDYAFFPIHKEITYNDLSPYQKKLINNKQESSISKAKLYYKSKKLIISLEMLQIPQCFLMSSS